jgi:glycosyltransferase involved in cell wall biosynthesis
MEVLEATAGGTRRHLRDLVHHLDRQRFDLTLVVSTLRDPDFHRDIALFHMEGVRVEILQMNRHITVGGDIRAVVEMSNLFRQYKPDVIHAHSSKAGMVARLAARRSGRIPVVYTPHALAFLSDSIFRKLYLALERRVAGYTRCLIAVSKEECDLAMDKRYGLAMDPKRVKLIPNGVDTGTLRPIDKRERQMVGFVGRLCRQKGPDFFLTVARNLYNSDKTLCFRMVGSGPWERWVMAKAARLGLSNCMEIKNVRDEVEAFDELAEMSLLLLPSRWEGLPYSLLEAMSVGVPTVAMAAGGIGDVIESGRSGFLCDIGDVHGMALQAQAVLRQAALSEQIRVAAHKRLAEFSLQKMVAETAKVYEEIA